MTARLTPRNECSPSTNPSGTRRPEPNLAIGNDCHSRQGRRGRPAGDLADRFGCKHVLLAGRGGVSVSTSLLAVVGGEPSFDHRGPMRRCPTAMVAMTAQVPM
jgi:hypothetical protein